MSVSCVVSYLDKVDVEFRMTKTLSKEYGLQARRIESLEEQINAISVGMNRLEVLSALTHIIQDIITEMKAEVVPLWEEL